MNVLVSSWDALKDVKGMIYFTFDDSPDQLKLVASLPKGEDSYINCEMIVRVITGSDGNCLNLQRLTCNIGKLQGKIESLIPIPMSEMSLWSLMKFRNMNFLEDSNLNPQLIAIKKLIKTARVQDSLFCINIPSTMDVVLSKLYSNPPGEGEVPPVTQFRWDFKTGVYEVEQPQEKKE